MSDAGRRSSHAATNPLSLKQNMLWNSLGCLFYQGCMWVMTIVVVTLSHDFDDAGVLAYAMAIGNIYYPLATYNMRTIQVSDVHNENSAGEYVGFRVATVLLAAAATTVYLLACASSMTLVIATLCWLVFKADESFVSVYYGVDQRALRMDYIGISQGVRGVLALAAFSGTLAAGASIEVAMLAVAAACIIVTVFYDRPHAARLDQIKPAIAARQMVALLKKYFPAVLTLVFYGAVVSVARQNFESMCGEGALGIYASVATPTVLVQVAASYLYSPLLGTIAQQWSSGETGVFLKSIAKVFAAIVAMAVVAVIISELAGASALVLVFGERIREYAWLLTPALAATAVTALFAFTFDMLMVIRNFKGALAANAVALAVSICASPAFIETFYMNGVNLVVIAAFGAGLVIGLGALAFSVYRAR